MFKSILTILAALLTLSPPVAHAAQNQHTKAFHFEVAPETIGDLATVRGSSVKLTRMDEGLAVRLNTRELLPGTYTLWWVIFNNPDQCAAWPDGGCNPFVDLADADVEAAVFYGSGGVVGPNGVAHLHAFTETGTEPADSGDREKVLISNDGLGLQNAHGAEVHIALRYHGPAAFWDPELLMKQIETSSGACDNGTFFIPDDPVPEHRIFGCFDAQVAVFLSPETP